MARILRGERGWGLFPKLELFSIAIGGFCGYHLGFMAAAYKEETLRRKEREVDRIKKKVADAISDMKVYDKKKEEFLRSLSQLSINAQRMAEKERALAKLEKELVERERKVRSAEEGGNGKNMECEG